MSTLTLSPAMGSYPSMREIMDTANRLDGKVLRTPVWVHANVVMPRQACSVRSERCCGANALRSSSAGRTSTRSAFRNCFSVAQRQKPLVPDVSELLPFTVGNEVHRPLRRRCGNRCTHCYQSRCRGCHRGSHLAWIDLEGRDGFGKMHCLVMHCL